jgi:hypothetical protein
VAERSKALSIFSHPDMGIASSNPSWGMAVCSLPYVYIVKCNQTIEMLLPNIYKIQALKEFILNWNSSEALIHEAEAKVGY